MSSDEEQSPCTCSRGIRRGPHLVACPLSVKNARVTVLPPNPKFVDVIKFIVPKMGEPSFGVQTLIGIYRGGTMEQTSIMSARALMFHQRVMMPGILMSLGKRSACGVSRDSAIAQLTTIMQTTGGIPEITESWVLLHLQCTHDDYETLIVPHFQELWEKEHK